MQYIKSTKKTQKIGILTFHKSINNGAFLQCYSLSKRLQYDYPDMDIEVIDYHMPKIDDFYSTTITSYLKGESFRGKMRKIFSLIINPYYLHQQRIKHNVFKNTHGYLPLSSKNIYSNSTKELFNFINNNYDCIVVGSDAIWNYTVRGFPNPYFLDKSITIPMLSYAASCYGMPYEIIPDKEKRIIKNILDSYAFLGIRDDESNNFLKHVGCITKGVHTCDPTVFLDINTLPINEPLLLEKLRRRGFKFDRDTIGVMGSNALCKIIKKFYGNKYQIVALYSYNRDADVNLFDINPFEWAYVFRFFKLCITTYFHGTLLSLKNGVPTICIALENDFTKNHISKVEDLLKRLDLCDWYFHTDYKTIGIDKIHQTADLLLKSDMSDMILKRLAIEALAYDNFKKALDNVLFGYHLEGKNNG